MYLNKLVKVSYHLNKFLFLLIFVVFWISLSWLPSVCDHSHPLVYLIVLPFLNKMYSKSKHSIFTKRPFDDTPLSAANKNRWESWFSMPMPSNSTGANDPFTIRFTLFSSLIVVLIKLMNFRAFKVGFNCPPSLSLP